MKRNLINSIFCLRLKTNCTYNVFLCMLMLCYATSWPMLIAAQSQNIAENFFLWFVLDYLWTFESKLSIKYTEKMDYSFYHTSCMIVLVFGSSDFWVVGGYQKKNTMNIRSFWVWNDFDYGDDRNDSDGDFAGTFHW